MFIEPWESLVSRASSPKKEGEVRGGAVEMLKKIYRPRVIFKIPGAPWCKPVRTAQ